MKDTTKQVNQEKVAAANYILTFFQEVGALTDNFCYYINTLVELENKYQEVDLNKVTEEENQQFKNLINTIRYYIIKTSIMYKTICANQNHQIKTDFLEDTKKLRDTLVFNREDLEKYVFTLNNFLADTIIKELQETSSQIVNNIYGE